MEAHQWSDLASDEPEYLVILFLVQKQIISISLTEVDEPNLMNRI